MHKIFIVVIALIIFQVEINGQIVIFNSTDSIYALAGNSNVCAVKNAGSYCGQDVSGGIYSTALFKDTLYFLTNKSNEIYRMKLGNISSCVMLPNFNPTGSPFGTVSINSLTTDKDGILYAVDGFTRQVFSYNPYTYTQTIFGTVPSPPAGDLIFYKDRLLLSTLSAGIIEVNLNNPEMSETYMAVDQYLFYGLISVPFDCTKNKYYGLSDNGEGTDVIEIDLETKTIIGLACKLPFTVYDAASNVDNGNTLGVAINSIDITTPACGNEAKATFNINASSASTGAITYNLDNSITNTTGIFENIDTGRHYIKIKNILGCERDSSFFIGHGLFPKIALSTISPQNCSLKNGMIHISATSQYPPVSYSIDGINFQASGDFTNLGAGSYQIVIKDSIQCSKDTTVNLFYLERPSFLSNISLIPSVCESKTGSITVTLTAGNNPADFTLSVNNGLPKPALTLNNLDSGKYFLSIIKLNECSYDTIIIIKNTRAAKPLISLNIRDQKCFDNNGKLEVNISGLNIPYLTNLDNTTYTLSAEFQNLSPGFHSLKIQDKNICTWDTGFSILPYEKFPVTTFISETDATCKNVNDGSIYVEVNGTQTPYAFTVNNNGIYYNENTYVNNLTAGKYVASIINKDGCIVDTISTQVNIIYLPECDNVFVPNAFSPNGDGINEVFKPIAGPGVKDVVFKLYNVYGNLVFQNSPQHDGWDGKVKGKEQDSGAYVWTLYYKTFTGEQKKLKGIFILIR